MEWPLRHGCTVRAGFAFIQPLSLLRRQGRVAAPSVCFAVARILLAAAPTAPHCFRRWRRSSPLPLVGEPLAKPFTLRGLPKPPLGRGGGTASAVTERLSLARASRSGCPLYNLSVCFADSSPSRGASGEEAKLYEMLRPSLGRSNSSKRNPTPAHSTINKQKTPPTVQKPSAARCLFSQQWSMDQALASLLCSAFL